MATTAVAIDQDVVTSEVFIAATPERVFQALTDKHQIPEWWGRPGAHITTGWEGDVRKGGRWRHSGESATGDAFEVIGEYLDVDPPHHLSQTWKATWTGDLVTTVDFTLEATARDGRQGTLLSVRHSGFASWGKAASHDEGWKRVFGWLREYLEGTILV